VCCPLFASLPPPRQSTGHEGIHRMSVPTAKLTEAGPHVAITSKRFLIEARKQVGDRRAPLCTGVRVSASMRHDPAFRAPWPVQLLHDSEPIRP
jgi:hypothetical protein